MSEHLTEKDHSWMTPEVLDQWEAEARLYPSGQRCNGVHDRTPDARIIELVGLVRELTR